MNFFFAKDNLKFRAVESRKIYKSTVLRCDQSIRLTVAKSRKNHPDKLRRIKYYDAEKDIRLVFLTNDFELDAMKISTVYQSRWQIEVLFKMDQAEPANQSGLGSFQERREDIAMDSDKHLPYRGVPQGAD